MLARLLHIRRRIESGEYPNRRGLAEELEVSVRTIARDVDFLRDTCGDPILYSQKHNGFSLSWSEMYGLNQPGETADLKSLA